MNKLILIIFFPFTLICQSLDNDKDADYYFRFADDSLRTDARLYNEYMTKAIEMDSINELYYFQRYEAYSNLGYTFLAIKDLKKALEIDSLYPNRIDSLYPNETANLYHLNPCAYFFAISYELYQLDGKYYESLDYINKAIDLEAEYYPEGNLDLYFHKLEVLNVLADYQEAIDVLNLIVDKYDEALTRDYDIYEVEAWHKSFISQLKLKLNNATQAAYNRLPDFYPNTLLTVYDSISYPFDIGLEFNLKSILDFKIDSNKFKADMSTFAYTPYPPEYIANTVNYPYYSLSSQDTIAVANLASSVKLITGGEKIAFNYYASRYWSPKARYIETQQINPISVEDGDIDGPDANNPQVKNPENAVIIANEANITHYYQYTNQSVGETVSIPYKDGFVDQSYIINSGNIEFDHVWDLSDFPFDEQKLQIKVLVELDSSIVRLHSWQGLGTKNHFNKVTGLPLGQKVEKVNFYTEYYDSGEQYQFSPTTSREGIFPVGVFEIIISRSGSFLFIKLFVGTLLAYIMSLFAFTIRKRNFASRIDVSVGALFISIGNKFFAESETPMVQILTKSDIINNISLLLIILNVIFIIGQHRTDINIGKFEDSYFTLKFSAVLMSLLLFITIIS